MIGAAWGLYIALYFQDGRVDNLQSEFNSKEVCLQFAKDQWRYFYEDRYTGTIKIATICSNKKNRHEFLNVVCDKSGNCTYS